MKDAFCEGVCLAARQLDVVFNGLLWDLSHDLLPISVSTSTSHEQCVFVSGLGT